MKSMVVQIDSFISETLKLIASLRKVFLILSFLVGRLWEVVEYSEITCLLLLVTGADSWTVWDFSLIF